MALGLLFNCGQFILGLLLGGLLLLFLELFLAFSLLLLLSFLLLLAVLLFVHLLAWLCLLRLRLLSGGRACRLCSLAGIASFLLRLIRTSRLRGCRYLYDRSFLLLAAIDA